MVTKRADRNLTRRDFLKVGIGTAGVYLLAACSSPTTAPTQAPAAPAAPTKGAAPAPTTGPAAAPTKAPAPTATPAPQGPKTGGTFIVARTPRINDFNGMHLVRANFGYIRALYNMLVRLDYDLNPQPELAESWKVSPDGLTLALKLRQGVKFHSGRDLTAEDVKFSHEWALDPANGAHLRPAYQLIKELKVVDNYSIELSFDKPNPLIFDALDTLCIYDKSTIGDISKTDVGSGPFMVDKYIPPNEIHMKRFDDYWDKGKPYVDEYQLKSIPDAAALVINLEAGAVDATWSPSFLDVARLKGQKGYAVDGGLGTPSIFHIAVNVTSGPLSNKKVRQAINHAIDRERCVRTALSDLVEPTWLNWPKGSWAYFPDLEGRYPYDLDKAKALLAEAGHADGFETSILLSKAINPPQFDLGQILQADLAKIGIKARIENVESGLYPGRIIAGKFEMAVHNYGRANRDPGTMLAATNIWLDKSEGGQIGFQSPDYVRWRTEAASTLDMEKRKALYRQIQEWFLDESFSMPIAPNQSFWLYRDYVKDLRFGPEWTPLMDNVWLDK
ncbi:MAG: ABC transporter substrate-binding protein [Dehalococcoidales bacterium]|nr:ABC transporter substrate-binding protein [Dehalococcoidales bacterium]